MATVSDITTAALARNRRNQPGIIATNTELLNAFRRIWPTFWVIAARVNPAFFGAREELEPDAESDPTGWLRPSNAELIYRLEFADGARAGEEITVVPLDERDAEPTRAAVYEWGQVYYPAGNDDDPALTDEIRAWYSKLPEDVDALSDELDSLWPGHFDELLVLELALLLATKDERLEEIPGLRSDRDVWLRRFIAHLEHTTVGVTRSTGQSQRFQGPTIVPLNELLIGGTEVSL